MLRILASANSGQVSLAKRAYRRVVRLLIAAEDAEGHVFERRSFDSS